MLGRWVIENGDNLQKERDSIQNTSTPQVRGHCGIGGRNQLRVIGSGILVGDFISLYTRSYACKVLSTWLQKFELNKEDIKEMWKQLEKNPAHRTISNKAWERRPTLVKNLTIFCPGQMVAPENLHTVTLHGLRMLHRGIHIWMQYQLMRKKP